MSRPRQATSGRARLRRDERLPTCECTNTGNFVVGPGCLSSSARQGAAKAIPSLTPDGPKVALQTRGVSHGTDLVQKGLDAIVQPGELLVGQNPLFRILCVSRDFISSPVQSHLDRERIAFHGVTFECDYRCPRNRIVAHLHSGFSRKRRRRLALKTRKVLDDRGDVKIPPHSTRDRVKPVQ